MYNSMIIIIIYAYTCSQASILSLQICSLTSSLGARGDVKTPANTFNGMHEAVGAYVCVYVFVRLYVCTRG